MTFPEKKIIIPLPALTWKALFSFRAILLFIALSAAFLFTYWYWVIYPFLWISTAHVDAFSSTITSDSVGKLSDITLSEGELIRKGEPLFTLENESAIQKQKKIQASLESLNAVMVSEKRRMEKAMQDYLASSAELDVGIGTAEAVDRHLTQLQDAQIKSEEAAAQMNQLNREFTFLNDRSKKFSAPFDAIVLKKLKNSGDLASIGEPICSLLDPNQVWIEAQIPEKELGLISLGTPAKVRLIAYPGKEWSGKIIWISPATVSKISSLPNTQDERISVKIALENKDFLLKPGLTARVGLKVH